MRPGGRSREPPAAAPEERGGGGRSELRQCPGRGSATLHLPSPHQGQVVVVAAFTVAVTSLAPVGAAESVAVRASGPPPTQAEPRRRLAGEARRTSGGQLGVAIWVQVPAGHQRASLRSCKGASQCQSWSLNLPAPYPPPTSSITSRLHSCGQRSCI